MGGTGMLPARRVALGAEQPGEALGLQQQGRKSGLRPGDSEAAPARPPAPPAPPLSPFLTNRVVYHSWVPCLNYRHDYDLDFRKASQPRACLVLMRVIERRLRAAKCH